MLRSSSSASRRTNSSLPTGLPATVTSRIRSRHAPSATPVASTWRQRSESYSRCQPSIFNHSGVLINPSRACVLDHRYSGIPRQSAPAPLGPGSAPRMPGRARRALHLTDMNNSAPAKDDRSCGEAGDDAEHIRHERDGKDAPDPATSWAVRANAHDCSSDTSPTLPPAPPPLTRKPDQGRDADLHPRRIPAVGDSLAA
jgi:hypothetical protein